MKTATCVVLCVAAALASRAGAQVTLNAAINVDNAFTAYYSTDDSALGTPFLSGNSWPTTYNVSIDLPAGGTYFLHVLAVDQGPPAMFIGTFTLSNAQAAFENGLQSLLTEPTDWRVSATGFGSDYLTPTDLGANGSGVWGSFPQQDPSARLLWYPGPQLTVYFSTRITFVPAPTVIALAPLAGLLALRRRR